MHMRIEHSPGPTHCAYFLARVHSLSVSTVRCQVSVGADTCVFMFPSLPFYVALGPTFGGYVPVTVRASFRVGRCVGVSPDAVGNAYVAIAAFFL